jgi:hypothetical protein
VEVWGRVCVVIETLKGKSAKKKRKKRKEKEKENLRRRFKPLAYAIFSAIRIQPGVVNRILNRITLHTSQEENKEKRMENDKEESINKVK